jgi:hypothetical protein
MTECIDHAAGQMRVPGAAHQPEVVPSDKLWEVVSEQYAVELRVALMNAVAGARHWRIDAEDLLRKLDNCILPKIPERY